MKNLIIIGAGGFSKSIIDSIDEKIYKIIGFIDSYKIGKHQGLPILTDSLEKLNNREKYVYFIGIGDPFLRKIFFDLLIKYNLEIINIIDKTAVLSKNINLGKGIFVGKLVVINADAVIEDNVVLNTRALIEHGNKIGKHSNISTNTVLNGDVEVGEETFIGSCTVVNGQIKIGKKSIIGSGSVVIRNIEDSVVAAGSPTRLIRRMEKNEK